MSHKLTPLNESMKTQIAYLMQGLMVAPTKEAFEGMLEKVVQFNGSFPPPVARACEAVLAELPSAGELGSRALHRAAARLLGARGDEAKQAGLALLWGLESAKPWP